MDSASAPQGGAPADSLLAYRIGKVEKLHTLAERLAEACRQDEETTRLCNEGRLEEANNRLAQLRATTEEILNSPMRLPT